MITGLFTLFSAITFVVFSAMTMKRILTLITGNFSEEERNGRINWICAYTALVSLSLVNLII
jgi:hypothetical protein